jgi:stringent starvation protein B
MHEWMTANNQTPHLVVDAASPAAEVPRAYVRDGRITLNELAGDASLKEMSGRTRALVSTARQIPVVSVLGTTRKPLFRECRRRRPAQASGSRPKLRVIK